MLYRGCCPFPFGAKGFRMADLFAGEAKLTHRVDEPIGYEAAGGGAIYLGDDKLVRSAPPCGDAAWRRYDIARDPAEANDLAQFTTEADGEDAGRLSPVREARWRRRSVLRRRCHRACGDRLGTPVVVLDQGVATSIDRTTLTQDVHAVAFGQRGLIAGVGLDGSKITPSTVSSATDQSRCAE